MIPLSRMYDGKALLFVKCGKVEVRRANNLYDRLACPAVHRYPVFALLHCNEDVPEPRLQQAAQNPGAVVVENNEGFHPFGLPLSKTSDRISSRWRRCAPISASKPVGAIPSLEYASLTIACIKLRS